MENIINYKKTIKVGKFIWYYLIIQIILLFLWLLIFILSTVTPYTDSFKANWNNAIITNNNTYIDKQIKNFNIQKTNVSKCNPEWFYYNKNSLFFCKDKRKYIFSETTSIKKVLDKRKDLVIKYWIWSVWFSILFIIVLFFINKTLFKWWTRIIWLTKATQELTNILSEIEEYIKTKWTRIDYRIESLEALILGIIEEEPDFFHRFWAKIKDLENLSKINYLYRIENRLHILYKEMEKIYFWKKRMYFNVLWSELSLILTKYNTSITSFVINILFFLILSIFILHTLILINWGNTTLLKTFISILNIFTFRAYSENIVNIYQQSYIIFLQIISYIIFVYSVQLTINKK